MTSAVAHEAGSHQTRKATEAVELRRLAAASIVENLTDRVRALVRSTGVDPDADPGAVAALVEAEVDSYERRSLSGSVDPLTDPAGTAAEVLAGVVGFGPLQRFLDDPEVEEIWINSPSKVFVARHGVHSLTPVVLTREQVRDLVERMLKVSGRRLDLSQPFVDAVLPGGHRLHVVLEGISRDFTAVNIRKFTLRSAGLGRMVELGSLTPQAAEFLRACVLAGQNIVVVGATQAGKTTMLNALASAIPGGQRVVSVEEVFEIHFDHPDWVAMQTRQAGLEGNGEVRLRDLVKESLRMRPSRIIVGEVRAEESLDLLLALNSGLPGLATLHANSAREGLLKLCTLPLLAGENISPRFVVPTVASCVDIVVHLRQALDGSRQVSEIVSVSGRVELDTIETESVFTFSEGRLRRASGMPARRERFEAVGVDLAAVLGDV